MSLNADYTSLIKTYDTAIEDKQQENKDLAEQEAEQKQLLKERSWQTYYLKRDLRIQKNKIYAFLREHGGLFNLNMEQKNFYTQMLSKKSSLTLNLADSSDIQYGLTQSITSLSNKQLSNNLSIFNDTLDKGKFVTQQALFNRVSENLA